MEHLPYDTLSMAESTRRLPWVNDLGKPCYLISDNSFPSPLADDAEEERLDEASELMDNAVVMLTTEETVPDTEFRPLANDLLASLHAVHGIATERGSRLTTLLKEKTARESHTPRSTS